MQPALGDVDTSSAAAPSSGNSIPSSPSCNLYLAEQLMLVHGLDPIPPSPNHFLIASIDMPCANDVPVPHSSSNIDVFNNEEQLLLGAAICNSHCMCTRGGKCLHHGGLAYSGPCGAHAPADTIESTVSTNTDCGAMQFDNMLQNWLSSTSPSRIEGCGNYMGQQLHLQATDQLTSPRSRNHDASSPWACCFTNSPTSCFSGMISDIDLPSPSAAADSDALFIESLPTLNSQYPLRSLNLDDYLDIEDLSTSDDGATDPANSVCVSYSHPLDFMAHAHHYTNTDIQQIDNGAPDSVHVSYSSSRFNADGHTYTSPTFSSSTVNTTSTARSCSDYAASLTSAASGLESASPWPNCMPSLPALKVATMDTVQVSSGGGSGLALALEKPAKAPHHDGKYTDQTRAIEVAGDHCEDEESVCFLVESCTPAIDDGYRWCKYGQKHIKHQLHPRCYFRCAQRRCFVKKQTEGSSNMQGFVLITYFGKHNHHPNSQT